MPVPFQGTHPQGYDYQGAGNLTPDRAKPEQPGQPVDHPAGDAGRGVDVFPEKQGLLVDEDVAQDTAERAGYHTHHHRHPHRIARGEGLLYADDHEKRQPQGVEYKQHAVVAHEHLAEKNHHGKGYAGHAEVEECLHPENGDVEQDVAQCAATDGRDQADGVSPEPVEAAECSQPYARDGKRDSAYDLNRGQKCSFQLTAQLQEGFTIIFPYAWPLCSACTIP